MWEYWTSPSSQKAVIQLAFWSDSYHNHWAGITSPHLLAWRERTALGKSLTDRGPSARQKQRRDYIGEQEDILLSRLQRRSAAQERRVHGRKEDAAGETGGLRSALPRTAPYQTPERFQVFLYSSRSTKFSKRTEWVILMSEWLLYTIHSYREVRRQTCW